METERLDNCQNIKIPDNTIYSYDGKKTSDDFSKGIIIDTILSSGLTRRIHYTSWIREHSPSEYIIKFEKEYGEPTTWNFETETLFYKTFVDYIVII